MSLCVCVCVCAAACVFIQFVSSTSQESAPGSEGFVKRFLQRTECSAHEYRETVGEQVLRSVLLFGGTETIWWSCFLQVFQELSPLFSSAVKANQIAMATVVLK